MEPVVVDVLGPHTYDDRHRELVLPVVRIRAGQASGSGTVIYSALARKDAAEHSTYVLTNEHVVDGLIKVEKKWSALLQREVKRDVTGVPIAEFFEYLWESRATGAAGVQADIMAYDKDEDLALLRLRREKPVDAMAKLYPRAQEKRLRVTMPVFCIGAGLAQPPVITQGMLSQFGQEIDNREYWLSTAPAIYGNSGGALFLAETHEFIGVPSRIAVSGVFGSDAITHLQWAIPITRVYEFLEAQRFRFIYDFSFTEEGEAAERKRLRDEQERAMAREEQRGDEEPA